MSCIGILYEATCEQGVEGDVCTSGGLEGRTGIGDEINLQPRLKVPTEGPVKNKISKDFQDL